MRYPPERITPKAVLRELATLLLVCAVIAMYAAGFVAVVDLVHPVTSFQPDNKDHP